MLNFEHIKMYFDCGLWAEQQVYFAVVKNVITAAQYEEITGEVYEEGKYAAPTQAIDRIEAQAFYTAVMTDTLLEEDM